jgi:hypothetical protein
MVVNDISMQDPKRPTRASAADEGVRPTTYADCPLLGKVSDIGRFVCQPFFSQLLTLGALIGDPTPHD